MNSDGLGLVITYDHEATVNSFVAVPVTFGAAPPNLPPRWVPPLPIESQGATSSCAGHSEALFFAHLNYVRTGEVKRFSRRFAYITAQSLGGFLGRDQGTSISSTLQAANKYGCCLETTCPFQSQYDTRLPQAAYTEAAAHRHHGDTNYDCRDFAVALAWLTDRRPIIIGTRWYAGQDSCNGLEDKRAGTSGQFRGYHARTLVGWETHNGGLVPVVQNSHGQSWGNHGRAVITPDLWDWWRRDANFFALGAKQIDEYEPQRRDWSELKTGDVV